LDIMMPEIDGWEVLKMLKVDEETRDIPVAMLSCKSETRDKVLGIQEGAVDYITKPFAPDDLIIRVREILEKSKKEK
ncbi:response regulator, partial [candidate division WOR-3 bacterium]|nr:response regulator [candidate division WOR-3 bacterium]